MGDPGAEPPSGSRGGKRVWVGSGKPGAAGQVCLCHMETTVEQDQIGGGRGWGWGSGNLRLDPDFSFLGFQKLLSLKIKDHISAFPEK